MGELEKFENLLSARNVLKTSLEESRSVGVQLEKRGPKIEEMKERVASLEASIGPISTTKCSLSAVKNQIDCAVGPVLAILKVLETLQDIENSLVVLSPGSNVFSYASAVKKLEEASKFLEGNCGLAIAWLDGIIEALEENPGVDGQCVSNVKKSIGKVRKLKEENVGGGKVLLEALEKLESEFRRIVSKNEAQKEDCSDKLQVIIERLRDNDRLENCLAFYVEARILVIRRITEDLDLGYLEEQVTELDDLEDMEEVVDDWCKDFEFLVKRVLEPEYKLCNEVFGKVSPDICISCFVKIATKSGIFSLLQFGKNVITESSQKPIKLSKLLDVFATLDNLRLAINRVFGHKTCAQVQDMTRDLIRRIVNGVCVIFFELPLQVKLQREISPLYNGSVPRLVSFVTEFCNKLLEDNYKKVLVQVLEIHQSWKLEKYQDEIFTSNIYRIIKEIALNLDKWSNSHHDITLSYLFMMNNHCHFSHQRGTKLGDMMGETWTKAHEQYRDYYLGLYIAESWGKIFSLLHPEGINYSLGQKTNTRDIKNNLKVFNESFDHVYKKHSHWVVPDTRLREKICHVLVKAFVPIYESYLVNFYVVVGQEVNARKYVKYSVDDLEEMLGSLFEQKLMKYGSSRSQFGSIGKIKSAFANSIHFMLAANS